MTPWTRGRTNSAPNQASERKRPRICCSQPHGSRRWRQNCTARCDHNTKHTRQANPSSPTRVCSQHWSQHWQTLLVDSWSALNTAFDWARTQHPHQYRCLAWQSRYKTLFAIDCSCNLKRCDRLQSISLWIPAQHKQKTSKTRQAHNSTYRASCHYRILLLIEEIDGKTAIWIWINHLKIIGKHQGHH